MDDAELAFPCDRLTRFKDIEGVGWLTANPRQLRERYLSRMHTFQENRKATCPTCPSGSPPSEASAMSSVAHLRTTISPKS